MKDPRADTLFALRYAVRVLERQAKLWAVIGKLFKFISILSGTVAVAAVVSSKAEWAVFLGIMFAVMQAIDHALDPAEKHAAALAQRRDYARLLADQTNHTDGALEAAYRKVVADDEIMVDQALKELAYNDVVREQGLPESACYPDHALMRLLS